MHIVSSILRRQLLQHTPVGISGIGTLHLVQTSVQRLTDGRLEPPRRMPELLPSAAYDTYLPEAVALELNIAPEEAAVLCEQWYAESWVAEGEDHLMVLEGVGTIRNSTLEYIPAPEFLDQLNPLPTDPFVVVPPAPEKRKREKVRKPKGKSSHGYTISFIAVVIVLAALAYLAYYLWVHTGLIPEDWKFF